MKRIILALCLLGSVAFAQNQPPQIVRRTVLPIPVNGINSPESDEVLPENFILSLGVTDKGKQITELAVVLATKQFTAETIDPMMNFTGTVSLQEDGTLLLRYSLSTQVAISSQNGQPVSAENPATSVQYRSSSVHSSVRLRVGESVVILKDGARTYQLAATRLAEALKKDKDK